MNRGPEKLVPLKLVMSGVLLTSFVLWAIIAATVILLVRLV
ncbi:MAG TPA: hypothetical protein VEY49_04060 [Solirubrobacteraceae bacterium]|jgi:hypothetical protein|nr:hypothetical protein [Solirubrobacteraceae bacterium]